LEEFECDDDKNDTKLGPGHVLIAAYDERTCSQLRDYLCDGGEAARKRLYNKMFKNPTTAAEPTETASFSEETVRGEALAEFPKDTDLPSSRLR